MMGPLSGGQSQPCPQGHYRNLHLLSFDLFINCTPLSLVSSNILLLPSGNVERLFFKASNVITQRSHEHLDANIEKQIMLMHNKHVFA